MGLAWLATQHERVALEAEVAKRARALTENLAGSAKEPLLASDDLTLNALLAAVGKGEGVVEARILGREGKTLASLDSEEVGRVGAWLPLREADAVGEPQMVRRAARLLVSTPILYSGVRAGEAQVELDLDVLVTPVVAESARQLAAVAIIIIVLGVVAGLGFVALLVGPLRRLRAGVERLSAGDLSVRVPPTSRDEVGELTRAFNEMGESLQQKARIQNAFGRYVNDYVLKQLLQTPEGDELAGAEREITILFADIRRFTRLSEGMKARDVVALLNEIFHLASECILARGGTIDKFMGDSVMAYFGAPVAEANHAQNAVQAAIDILCAVETRNQRKTREGTDIPVHLGFGIHTGTVVVGNIGSERRADYTAVGDAVNVAHRLEKLALPGQILISEAVRRSVRGAFAVRFEGERQLSGRQEPVHVYALETKPPLSPSVEAAAASASEQA